jgi:hypothetical protein
MKKIILKKEYLDVIKQEKELLDYILEDLHCEYLENDMNEDIHYLEPVEELRNKLILKKDSSKYNFDCKEYLNYLHLLSEERYEEMTNYEIE